ncbi:MAG: sugar phosphate isomerase/epimerase [Acidobacteria bacterium]|nr:sugar phosphate isomerase/epimerase [Acidobacteriota bacterium]
MNRRQFFGLAAAAAASSSQLPAAGRLRIGVTDWNLKMSSDLAAVPLAASLGFEGLEVSLGRKPVDNQLPLADPGLQQKYRDAFRQHKIDIAGTCLDILHVNYLKLDPLGAKWVADGISISQRMGAKVILLPFFGRGALLGSGTAEGRAELDRVGDTLRELAPAAAKAGLVLALENTINARDNFTVIERSRSSAVKIYYDCGNLLKAGFDPITELKAMGRDGIAQIHLKDNPSYMGQGTIDFTRILEIVGELGWSGFANLETDAPSKDIAADMQKNLDFIRRLLARTGRG